MKGVLKPISIHQYGLWDEEKKDWVGEFIVEDPVLRRKINKFWGKVVDYDKDLKPILGDKVKNKGVDSIRKALARAKFLEEQAKKEAEAKKEEPKK